MVSQFYTELFNYCFPVNYWMQLWKTLARCHQNNKSVAEYTHELQDLFNMIGNVPKQDQVLKFWNSARSSIQKELWKNKLNPELSSWKTVITQAEIIEIAENVAERRDRKAGPSSQTVGAASGSGRGNPKHKHHPADGSVRAFLPLGLTTNPKVSPIGSPSMGNRKGCHEATSPTREKNAS